jgi:hypothetical protein
MRMRIRNTGTLQYIKILVNPTFDALYCTYGGPCMKKNIYEAKIAARGIQCCYVRTELTALHRKTRGHIFLFKRGYMWSINSIQHLWYCSQVATF